MNRKEHTCVVGLQWGDEAKGKVVDSEAGSHDVVIRYNGGPNAGHSVQANGHEISLHGLPSGVLHRNVKMYITPGCVVSMPGLMEEIYDVRGVTGEDVRGRLGISPKTPVIQPHQILNDLVTMDAIGTTGKGIGGAYAGMKERMEGPHRVDIRMAELLEYPEECFSWMRRNLVVELERARAYKDMEPEDLARIIARFEDIDGCIDVQRLAFEELRSCIDIDPDRLIKYLRQNMRMLFETAQSAELDNMHGVPPYTTASHIGVSAALHSAGLPHDIPVRTIGVGKLITSRVGHGPFVSEFGGKASEDYCMEERGKKHTKDVEQQMFGEHTRAMLASGDDLQIGQAIRLMTREYGVTSKRPRRVGAFDAFQFHRAANDVHFVQSVVLSKFDCLRIFSLTRDGQIPIVTGYDLDGTSLEHIPTTERTLRTVTPRIEYFPAFGEDVSDIRNQSELPRKGLRFLGSLQEIIGRPISVIGVGPARDQVIPISHL